MWSFIFLFFYYLIVIYPGNNIPGKRRGSFVLFGTHTLINFLILCVRHTCWSRRGRSIGYVFFVAKINNKMRKICMESVVLIASNGTTVWSWSPFTVLGLPAPLEFIRMNPKKHSFLIWNEGEIEQWAMRRCEDVQRALGNSRPSYARSHASIYSQSVLTNSKLVIMMTALHLKAERRGIEILYVVASAPQ